MPQRLAGYGLKSPVVPRFCSLAMVNATISLYYYILVVKAAYLLEPDEEPARLVVTTPTKVLTVVLVTVMVVMGVYPHHLLEVARAAARALLL